MQEIGAVFLSLTPMRDTTIKRRLAFWINRFSDRPLADLTPDDVDAALAVLEITPGKTGKIKSGPTINRYRMAMQSLIKFGRQKRLLPRGWVSPFADIPQHNEHPGKLRFLTLDEEQRLMHAARLQSWALLPLIIRLGIVTGLRRGALLSLRWRNVVLDVDSPRIEIERTKNGDAHVSPITPDLVDEFRRMRRIRSDAGELLDVNNVLRYYDHMIKSFQCRDTESLFNGKRVKRFVNFERIAMRKLQLIDAAGSIEFLKVPPGNRLEMLKGGRSGQWSIRINDQWRVCFKWKNGNATDVEIVDYH